MSMFQKIKDFFVGSPPDEVITHQFVDQPKDYPESLSTGDTESTVDQPGDTI